ncbi:DUS4L protein [Salpingoeca rosetta]|uniref:DUS4L protein n=1 Tax=Salpingoeca rosetta (strain ATCC 50818 / BSB-021) TaxID=946362 RepID=F2U0J1_SALR5|nr:DUS4L protein [Salpingoeca rosetta]EGD80919.1 DUS4L protein [Salpingoeca rosetta]|eukprot:XP_004997480.1 DUS4L protein [Salpingoeca rosetta]
MIGRDRERVDIGALFRDRASQGDFVRICAPMVRYSQLAFRHVVRRHGVDVAFTPMIVSDSFVQSWRAREADFATSTQDEPVVAQFAAANARDFAHAAALMAPYADAIDLNCGCPQKWAMQDGLGSHLVSKPELVADMVKQARALSGIPVSIKIRLRNTTAETVELCRRAEQMGAAWISVHGRSPKERRCPVHYDEIAAVKAAMNVPVVANGDAFSLDDARMIVDKTGAEVSSTVMKHMHQLEVAVEAKGQPSHVGSQFQEPLERIEEQLRELEQRTLRDMTKLRETMKKDRTAIVMRVDHLRKSVDAMDKQQSETAGGLQALNEWRTAITPQIDTLLRNASAPHQAPMSAQSGSMRDVHAAQSGVPQDRLLRLERGLKKEMDDRINPLIKNMYDSQKAGEDQRTIVLQELRDIRTRQEDAIADVVDRMRSEFTIMLANVRNSADDAKGTAQAVAMSTQDQITELRKTLEPGLRTCADDVEHLKLTTRDFSSRNNLVWGSVGELKQELEASKRKVVHLERSVAQLKDVIKDLLSRLFDRHIRPLQQKVDAIAKAMHHAR